MAWLYITKHDNETTEEIILWKPGLKYRFDFSFFPWIINEFDTIFYNSATGNVYLTFWYFNVL